MIDPKIQEQTRTWTSVIQGTCDSLLVFKRLSCLFIQLFPHQSPPSPAPPPWLMPHPACRQPTQLESAHSRKQAKHHLRSTQWRTKRKESSPGELLFPRPMEGRVYDEIVRQYWKSLRSVPHLLLCAVFQIWGTWIQKGRSGQVPWPQILSHFIDEETKGIGETK